VVRLVLPLLVAVRLLPDADLWRSGDVGAGTIPASLVALDRTSATPCLAIRFDQHVTVDIPNQLQEPVETAFGPQDVLRFVPTTDCPLWLLREGVIERILDPANPRLLAQVDLRAVPGRAGLSPAAGMPRLGGLLQRENPELLAGMPQLTADATPDLPWEAASIIYRVAPPETPPYSGKPSTWRCVGWMGPGERFENDPRALRGLIDEGVRSGDLSRLADHRVLYAPGPAADGRTAESTSIRLDRLVVFAHLSRVDWSLPFQRIDVPADHAVQAGGPPPAASLRVDLRVQAHVPRHETSGMIVRVVATPFTAAADAVCWVVVIGTAVIWVPVAMAVLPTTYGPGG
jgi:hypothetical protein